MNREKDKRRKEKRQRGRGEEKRKSRKRFGRQRFGMQQGQEIRDFGIGQREYDNNFVRDMDRGERVGKIKGKITKGVYLKSKEKNSKDSKEKK